MRSSQLQSSPSPSIDVPTASTLQQRPQESGQCEFRLMCRLCSELSHSLFTQIYNNRLVTDLRQLMTLHQHYYPEGGWGWIILFIATLVQCIAHGLHMAVGVLLVTIESEFEQSSFLTGS